MYETQVVEKKSTKKESQLSKSQIDSYTRDGFLVLENFIPDYLCDMLIHRANQLIDELDASEVKSIFSTVNPYHIKDDYFLQSGDQIRFFFEENSFDEFGELKKEKGH